MIKFLGMISGVKVKFAIATFLFTIICGTLWYQHSQLGVLRSNNAKLEVSIGLQRETVTSLEEGLHAAIENNKILADKIAIANLRQRKQIRRLNLSRGRLGNVALEKPTSVERIINRSTADVMLKFEQITGNNN
jgi:hypothetical protein